MNIYKKFNMLVLLTALIAPAYIHSINPAESGVIQSRINKNLATYPANSIDAVKLSEVLTDALSIQPPTPNGYSKKDWDIIKSKIIDTTGVKIDQLNDITRFVANFNTVVTNAPDPDALKIDSTKAKTIVDVLNKPEFRKAFKGEYLNILLTFAEKGLHVMSDAKDTTTLKAAIDKLNALLPADPDTVTFTDNSKKALQFLNIYGQFLDAGGLPTAYPVAFKKASEEIASSEQACDIMARDMIAIDRSLSTVALGRSATITRSGKPLQKSTDRVDFLVSEVANFNKLGIGQFPTDSIADSVKPYTDLLTKFNVKGDTLSDKIKQLDADIDALNKMQIGNYGDQTFEQIVLPYADFFFSVVNSLSKLKDENNNKLFPPFNAAGVKPTSKIEFQNTLMPMAEAVSQALEKTIPNQFKTSRSSSNSRLSDKDGIIRSLRVTINQRDARIKELEYQLFRAKTGLTDDKSLMSFEQMKLGDIKDTTLPDGNALESLTTNKQLRTYLDMVMELAKAKEQNPGMEINTELNEFKGEAGLKKLREVIRNKMATLLRNLGDDEKNAIFPPVKDAMEDVGPRQ